MYVSKEASAGKDNIPQERVERRKNRFKTFHEESYLPDSCLLPSSAGEALVLKSDSTAVDEPSCFPLSPGGALVPMSVLTAVAKPSMLKEIVESSCGSPVYDIDSIPRFPQIERFLKTSLPDNDCLFSDEDNIDCCALQSLVNLDMTTFISRPETQRDTRVECKLDNNVAVQIDSVIKDSYDGDEPNVVPRTSTLARCNREMYVSKEASAGKDNIPQERVERRKNRFKTFHEESYQPGSKEEETETQNSDEMPSDTDWDERNVVARASPLTRSNRKSNVATKTTAGKDNIPPERVQSRKNRFKRIRQEPDSEEEDTVTRNSDYMPSDTDCDERNVVTRTSPLVRSDKKSYVAKDTTAGKDNVPQERVQRRKNLFPKICEEPDSDLTVKKKKYQVTNDRECNRKKYKTGENWNSKSNELKIVAKTSSQARSERESNTKGNRTCDRDVTITAASTSSQGKNGAIHGKTCEKSKSNLQEMEQFDESDDSMLIDIEECLLDSDAEFESQQPKIYVKCSSNTNGRRVFDKNHYCLYCSKPSTNLRKHLWAKHKDEDYVKDVLTQAKHSKKRKLLLDKLRNLGDFQHNSEVRCRGEGEIIPWRCPPEPVSANDYVPCPDCFAYFHKEHLWRHHQDCAFCTKADGKHSFKSIKAEAELLLPSTVEVSLAFREQIFTMMSKDHIGLVAQNDQTLASFGENMFKRLGHLKHLHTHISAKMRELARLVIAVRKLDSNVTWMADVLCPEKFNTVLTAVKELCGYTEDSHKYHIPSLAIKLGHSIKMCCKLSICVSIRLKDTMTRQSREDFLYLCQQEWTSNVSSAALSTLSSAKLNRPQVLPLTEDIRSLNSYILSERRRYQTELRKVVTFENWTGLLKVTVVGVILFNRRRSGEVERMTLNNYQNRCRNPLAVKDIASSLSETEKVICRTMARVEIRGKKGRTVPVILTPGMIEAIDVLITCRKILGVAQSNQYVFPRPYSDNPVRASDCLRKMSIECGAKFPGNLTSTRLRKHIATTSQILNLQENELDLLAGFLGHDVRIHRHFYRLPQDTLQLAKVSKILLAFDRGQISDYKGKSLEDIEVENVEVLSDSDQSDSDEETETLNSDNVPLETVGRTKAHKQRRRIRQEPDNKEEETGTLNSDDMPSESPVAEEVTADKGNVSQPKVDRHKNRFKRILQEPGSQEEETGTQNSDDMLAENPVTEEATADKDNILQPKVDRHKNRFKRIRQEPDSETQNSDDMPSETVRLTKAHKPHKESDVAEEPTAEKVDRRKRKTYSKSYSCSEGSKSLFVYYEILHFHSILM